MRLNDTFCFANETRKIFYLINDLIKLFFIILLTFKITEHFFVDFCSTIMNHKFLSHAANDKRMIA